MQLRLAFCVAPGASRGKQSDNRVPKAGGDMGR